MHPVKGNKERRWKVGQSGHDSAPSLPHLPAAPQHLVPWCPCTSGLSPAYSCRSHSVDPHFPTVSSGCTSGGSQVPQSGCRGLEESPQPACSPDRATASVKRAAGWQQAGSGLLLILWLFLSTEAASWMSQDHSGPQNPITAIPEFQSRVGQSSSPSWGQT